MESHEQLTNLHEAYIEYSHFLNSLDKKQILLAGIQTALIRHTLPGLGLPYPRGKKMTQAEISDGLELMKTIPVAEIDNLLEHQATVFEMLGNVKSQRTYRMHLKKMVTWARKQTWWRESKGLTVSHRCPQIRRGRGRVSDIRVTDRKLTPKSPNWFYGLKDKTIPGEQWKEIDQFCEMASEDKESTSLLKHELLNYFVGYSLSTSSQVLLDQLMDSQSVSLSTKKVVRDFLASHEISPKLRDELSRFETFQTSITGSRKRQDKALRQRSAEGHVLSARRQLGALHRLHGIPLDQLELRLLVPHSGLTDAGQRDEDAVDDVVDRLTEHLEWLRQERDTSPNNELKTVEARVAVAKFLYHRLSARQPRQERVGKRVGYRDIPVIEAFRELECEIMERINTAPRRSDESKQWIDWSVFKACVEQLYQECAPRDKKYKRRSDTAIAQSYQVFLIFALLAAFPDRQRTIRELEVGRTLIRMDGYYQIVHSAEDFKTGEAFCKKGGKRIVPLPEELTPLLDEWLNQWRRVFSPQHSFVFTQKNGKPLTASSLYSYFRKRAFRLTGKAFTPHLVRDAIVTHLHLTQAPDAVLDALAQLMAHSRKIQQKIYDRRTSEEKIAPALEALKNTSIGDLPKHNEVDENQ